MSLDQRDQAWRDAVAILARRDFSQQELSEKLFAKGHDTTLITTIIEELIQAGYLNDQRLIENFIRSRQDKGYGPERIRLELANRGIAEETIAEQLHITDNAWLTTVRKVWQKHFHGQQPSNLKEKAKQMRFLQYKGFTQEQIESVLDPYDH